MTKFLTYAFVGLWFVMGTIELHNGDMFHMVTSYTICAWNASFIRDLKKLEN